MMQTIVFHSFAAKRVFVRQNAISPNEVESETPGSITFKDEKTAAFFANNVHVYQVQA